MSHNSIYMTQPNGRALFITLSGKKKKKKIARYRMLCLLDCTIIMYNAHVALKSYQYAICEAIVLGKATRVNREII